MARSIWVLSAGSLAATSYLASGGRHHAFQRHEIPRLTIGPVGVCNVPMAAGDELLIVDAADTDREGMRGLFEGQGYVCTATGDAKQAIRQARRKFFPAAVVALDLQHQGAGLDFVRAMRQASPSTTIVLLARRRSFEDTIEAFRLGVLDVVLKESSQTDQLVRVVHTAVDRYRTTDKSGALMRSVQDVLDEAFRVVLALAEASLNTEGASGVRPVRVLLVEPDAEVLRELDQLTAEQPTDSTPWEIVAEMTGGAALDKASSESLDIVAARDLLPDLPGSLVVKSLQEQAPHVLGLVYGDKLERFEGGRSVGGESFQGGSSQLVDEISRLAQAVAALLRQRACLAVLRREHGDFLRRYAELKARIEALPERCD